MEDFRPPLVPNCETVLADEPIFAEACKSALAADAEKFGWVYGQPLVTLSSQHGLIWRVDFVTPRLPARPGWVNRAMCWGSADNLGVHVAFGQKIAPLEQS